MEPWAAYGETRTAAGEPPALVTVGIPAFNNAATIARAVRSVRAQTVRTWRLVISDDSSRDGTAALCEELAARDQRIRVIWQPRNLLYMNFGAVLRVAETPYFAWLGADDVWHPTFLERCLAALEARPDAVSAVPRCSFVRDAAIVSQDPDTASLEGSWPDRAAAFLARPNGTRMYGLYRTEVLRSAFPPRNMYAYDFAMTLAALREGPQIGIDQVLLTRTRTPWQAYPRSVRTLYRSRILRALPLLDMTAYVLRRGLVPFRPATLAQLAVLNAAKHEDYMMVKRPALYARLLPLYRALSFPAARRNDTALGLGVAMLEDPSPSTRARGVDLLERLAASGQVEADLALGRHWRRQGVFPSGEHEAARHFARAARHGSFEAGFELIRAELDCGRVGADAAGGLYLAAALQGSPQAAAELARLICAGKAGPLDLVMAHEVLKAARGSGHPTVLRALALMAERGLGRPRDRARAVALNVMAAALDPRAARDVGRLLVEEAAPGGLAEAEHWYRRAASDGDAWALRDLAELLAESGRPAEARATCLRAAAAGSSPELVRQVEALLARLPRAAPGGRVRPVEGPAGSLRAAGMVAGQEAPVPEQGGGMRDVVVWGVHRSGTSVLTEALEAMGWWLGPTNRARTVENPRGFFENRALVDLNRQVLAAAGTSWSNWATDFPALRFDDAHYDAHRRSARALLEALDDDAGGAWALKDPRLTLLAAFWVPIFAERRRPPRHLILVRDPREVAASQATRSLHDPAAYRLLHRPEAMLVLWCSSMVTALRALAGEEVLVVAQHEFAADPSAALAHIAAFAGVPDQPTAAAGSVFEACYHRSTPGRAACSGPWDDMARQLYLRLATAAHAPLTPDATATLLPETGEIERSLRCLGPAAGLLAAFEQGEDEWFGLDA